MSGYNPVCAFGCNTTGVFAPDWMPASQSRPTFEPTDRSSGSYYDADILREIVKDAVRDVLAERWNEVMEEMLTRYEDAWKRLAKE